ncbi:MAG: hypothetical protein HQK77_13100 [Desulfobacterales bacterium]|nr:hypothetical protein [Desulfobacterales bacterium]
MKQKKITNRSKKDIFYKYLIIIMTITIIGSTVFFFFISFYHLFSMFNILEIEPSTHEELTPNQISDQILKKMEIDLQIPKDQIKKEIQVTTSKEKKEKKDLKISNDGSESSMLKKLMFLELQGTITGNKQDPVAIIIDGGDFLAASGQKRPKGDPKPDKEEFSKFYKTGEKVYGAVVKKIERGEVILSYMDREIVLISGKLPRYRLVGKTFDKNISKSEIQNILQNDMDQEKKADLAPHTEQGRSNGLVIKTLTSDSVFKKFDIQENDILLAINGIKVKSLEDVGFAFMVGINNSEMFWFDIQRNGEKQVIGFSFK